MKLKNPVRNLLSVTAADATVLAAVRADALALARAKDAEGAMEDAAGRIIFTVDWEPAFKDVKELSTKFKDATLTLYGDAFVKSNWISKTIYQGGKASEDATLSRIDGDHFLRLYREIFGENYAAR
jgi:hypothetical protein